MRLFIDCKTQRKTKLGVGQESWARANTIFTNLDYSISRYLISAQVTEKRAFEFEQLTQTVKIFLKFICFSKDQ
jgi:hypothetical protein